MRYIVLVLLLIAGGCSYSNSNAGNGEVRLKNITIQINDHQNNEQEYTIQIMTNGKEFEKIAVLHEVTSLITNRKKQVKVDLVTGIPYTIRVFKANIQPNQNPKTEESLSDRVEPLTIVKYTPTIESDHLNIQVNAEQESSSSLQLFFDQMKEIIKGV